MPRAEKRRGCQEKRKGEKNIRTWEGKTESPERDSGRQKEGKREQKEKEGR